MATRKIADESYMLSLKSVLENHFHEADYSLNGYQECSVCMEFENNSYTWLVYIGERGIHHEEVKCNTPLQACVEFLHRIAYKTDEVNLLESELIEHLYNIA